MRVKNHSRRDILKGASWDRSHRANEPLSLTLSPLRGARELAMVAVVVSVKCHPEAATGISVIDSEASLH
jgi:hypothetical protein